MAESPPPTTAISFPEKKKPSQVAQEETPWPISACSLGNPSQRAEAPLAMIRVRAWTVSLPRFTAKGRASQVHADHVAQLILRAESARLLPHVLDQLGPLDAFGKTRKILHQGGQ